MAKRTVQHVKFYDVRKKHGIYGMVIRLLLFIAYRLITLYCLTWRIKIIGEDYLNQCRDEKKGLVLALWHDQLLPLTVSQRKKGMATIASQSDDGEFITTLLHIWGYDVARGSSSRGGAAAIVGAKKFLKQGLPLAITVDGPTGPRHKVKPGAIYVAKRTNTQIVPAFANVKNYIRFGTWDKLILPLPFSKVEVFFTEPVSLSEDVSEESVNIDRRMIEKVMLERTSEISPNFI
ncbi:MAG: lysophospholipid acyltransferase family protein [Deferribacteraceae bacterium]|jgi:lysophospholipid acyltransferase (LPLAT)-like uncharacterized protein|nr:lysophospholipid acyltransferase family protein [Deferribacteraceae bacterium]